MSGMGSGVARTAAHMHPHSGASVIAADLYSIADLIDQPEPATAARRIWGRPDLPRKRIGDPALVLNLANNLIAGDPERDSTRPANMSKRVRGQLGDCDDQVLNPVRRQASLMRPGSRERPYASQAAFIPEHLGPAGWSSQRLPRPRPPRC